VATLPKRPRLIPVHGSCGRCKFTGNVLAVGSSALCIACLRVLKPEMFSVWCRRVAVEQDYRFGT
jgi:hypothetical protein